MTPHLEMGSRYSVSFRKVCGIDVLRGDPEGPNVDGFWQSSWSDRSSPLHWQTSAERMVLIAGELHVTYDGRKKRRC